MFNKYSFKNVLFDNMLWENKVRNQNQIIIIVYVFQEYK